MMKRNKILYFYILNKVQDDFDIADMSSEVGSKYRNATNNLVYFSTGDIVRMT